MTLDDASHDGGAHLDPAAGIADTLDRAAAILQAAGIGSARLDARLIIAAATGWSREQLLVAPHLVPDRTVLASIEEMVARRRAREPLSHILGVREFWSLPFRVSPDVLTPRPESETLVQAVIERARTHGPPATLLDLGTGSGCLLLALLTEFPEAIGTGVDRSAAALDVAAANAHALGLAGRVHMRLGDWCDGIEGRFEAIVTNPPYIPAGDIGDLQPEVARFEPRIALDGGGDGLDAYRRLLSGIRRLLVSGGVAALEVGAGQADAVSALGTNAGLRFTGRRRDLAGIDRVVLFDG